MIRFFEIMLALLCLNFFSNAVQCVELSLFMESLLCLALDKNNYAMLYKHSVTLHRLVSNEIPTFWMVSIAF